MSNFTPLFLFLKFKNKNMKITNAFKQIQFATIGSIALLAVLFAFLKPYFYKYFYFYFSPHVNPNKDLATKFW